MKNTKIFIEKVENFLNYKNIEQEYIKEIVELLKDDIESFEEIFGEMLPLILVDHMNDLDIESYEELIVMIDSEPKTFLDMSRSILEDYIMIRDLYCDYSKIMSGEPVLKRMVN